MLWHIGEWAGTVLAAGVVAGLVVVTLGVVAGWLVYRRARRRVGALTSTAARYALQTAPVMAAVRQRRLPPQVVYYLRRRLGSTPGLE
jgi:ethanolamine transporter EutH